AVPTPTPTPTLTPTPDPIARVQFSSGAYSPIQACTAVAVTVVRSGDTSSAATVDYLSKPFSGPASMAANYGHITGHLSFMPGETSKTFQVLIMKDGVMFPGFSVYLANAQGVDYGPVRSVNFYVGQPEGGTSGDPQNFVCQQ